MLRWILCRSFRSPTLAFVPHSGDVGSRDMQSGARGDRAEGSNKRCRQLTCAQSAKGCPNANATRDAARRAYQVALTRRSASDLEVVRERTSVPHSLEKTCMVSAPIHRRPPTGSLANRQSNRTGSGASWGKGGGSAGVGNQPPRTGRKGASRMGAAPPTGRPGSSMRGGFGMAYPFNFLPRYSLNFPLTFSWKPAGFQVLDRPMTQQGLGGIKTAAQGAAALPFLFRFRGLFCFELSLTIHQPKGPGRMIQDKTFFQSELRQRINLILAEINRLSSEYDAMVKENSNLSSFEKRADGLVAELRDLQGQLGDLNMLVDKLHTDTDLEDIERMHQHLKAKNIRETLVLDEVFLERQQLSTISRR
ncbi:hypothetical protein BDK51DRAFT_27644 [Blyttiomyces helicus]|uniref:Uncharacterized protein n=1 Tax=Blyttiomyces helicus TaxID=388810 RepID=A0A4P9WDC2_9FUNG|nr:hypothetical protein BDK51DRAFT_27644 [Blyttiomyces helicus]|eukprot:RKO88950.1 hypothetical protein BDK51DRAFT_27644 [Blyttiomyces helicus]